MSYPDIKYYITFLTQCYKDFEASLDQLSTTANGFPRFADVYTAILWDVASGKGHTGSVYSVVFSSDGKTLASGSADNTIRLWDVKTQKHIYTLTGHNGEIKGLAFTQDGSKLVSGSADGTLLVWKIPTH